MLREVVEIAGIPSRFAVESTGIQISYRSFATKWQVNDSPYLIPLLEGEEKIEEVYADKGYDSVRNIRFVLSRGGKPYIAIRENASRGLRRRLLKLSKSQEWKEKYSHRNVVESVFHFLQKSGLGSHPYTVLLLRF